jgi:hypothetical protein
MRNCWLRHGMGPLQVRNVLNLGSRLEFVSGSRCSVPGSASSAWRPRVGLGGGGGGGVCRPAWLAGCAFEGDASWYASWCVSVFLHVWVGVAVLYIYHCGRACIALVLSYLVCSRAVTVAGVATHRTHGRWLTGSVFWGGWNLEHPAAPTGALSTARGGNNAAIVAGCRHSTRTQAVAQASNLYSVASSISPTCKPRHLRPWVRRGSRCVAAL